MPEPLALTLDAAAESISVSPRTVPRLLDAGELGRVKIGRAVRVHAESLRAYVERQSLGLGGDGGQHRRCYLGHRSSTAGPGHAVQTRR